MMKHLKQLNGIRGLLPYLKTKRSTVLLIFFLSVIDAGLSLLPIQIIAAVVDLLSTGRSAFSPILGTSLTLHLVFFGVVKFCCFHCTRTTAEIQVSRPKPFGRPT